MLSVGSLFSGIGGFDLGLERAGMRVVWQCEADAWCRGILARHWPGVPCYEDVRLVGRDDGRPARGRNRDAPHRHDGRSTVAGVDLLCGGFPCQDLSVAGRRAGLAGERSGLFFEFARVADELLQPGGWILVENVPGLLSSHDGRDFAVLLATLAELGFHDLAWRVLDSRYFGVPQRRRRVFIVGRRAVGDGARAVLLEPESGGGDFAPGREAWPGVAEGAPVSTLQPGGKGRRGHRIDAEGAAGGHLVASAIVRRYAKGTDSDATDTLIARPLKAGGNDRHDESHETYIAHTLRAEDFDASEDGTGRGTPLTVYSGHGEGEADHANALSRPSHGSAWKGNSSDTFVCAPTDSDGVRAATGLPRRMDDPQPDGPRYAACGNAVTVPVAEWIGRRILSYEVRENEEVP